MAQKFDPSIYLGNPNLPSSKAEFEYTPQMLAEMDKCAKDISHFAETHFFITTMDEGKKKIKLFKPQKRVLKCLNKNNRVCVLSSRQSGKTTLMTIFALHMTQFNKDKTVLIVANKEATAIEILRRIRMAYEHLPNWLKSGIKEWGKTAVVFANDSRIIISSTSSSSSRGQTANALIIDEASFIAPHIMDEFWSSVVPIISSSSNTKIFLISTSNGTANKFYEIYSKAERGENEWHHERIDWWEIPGRGKKWQQDMIDSLGSQEAFDQEFGNQFIETGESAISGTILDRWRNYRKPPIVILEQGHYQIWEPPQPGRIYSIGVDVSEGVGEAASVAQVLDITDLTNIRQVACFHDSLIDPHFFAETLLKIANQWGRPYLCIERNNAGGQVLDALYHTHGYNKFLNIATTGGAKDRLGIYSSTGTKYRGVSNMRYWVNTLDALDVNDIGLIQELETFIRRPNGVWKKKDGQGIRDDRVDALFWALIILETEYAEQYFTITAFDDRGKPKKIEQVEIEAPEFYKLDEYYQKTNNAPSPLLFGFEPDDPNNPTISELTKQGWGFAARV